MARRAGKARRYAPRRGSGVIGTELPATRGIAIHDAIAHASQPSVHRLSVRRRGEATISAGAKVSDMCNKLAGLAVLDTHVTDVRSGRRQASSERIVR
jgi:hypothetical protein